MKQSRIAELYEPVSGRDEAALEPEPVFEASNVFSIWLNMSIFICRTCFWTLNGWLFRAAGMAIIWGTPPGYIKCMSGQV